MLAEDTAPACSDKGQATCWGDWMWRPVAGALVMTVQCLWCQGTH